jgi:hypothetical protein
MGKIPPEKVENVWKRKWKQCSEFDEEQGNSRFPITQFVDIAMNKGLFDNWFNKEKWLLWYLKEVTDMKQD